jgi:hypothetical protein
MVDEANESASRSHGSFGSGSMANSVKYIVMKHHDYELNHLIPYLPISTSPNKCFVLSIPATLSESEHFPISS